jgi:tetratricopeptide (TPR) repeat protein
VNKGFAAALKAYKKGNIRGASKMLQKLLRKYPTHTATNVLYAKILYRRGKVRAAAKYFKRVPSGSIGADVAYAYGISMFEVKKYSQAIKGFSKVSRKSKERYLALFYRGASLMRVGQWSRAVASLRAATKLPSNLRSSRRRLLNTAQSRARAERRGQSTAGTYVIVPTPPPQYAAPVAYPGQAPGLPPDPTAPKQPGGKPGKPAKPAPPPPPPKAQFSNALTPSITIKQSQGSKGFHGLADAESESQTVTLKVADKARYDMAPQAHGGQGHLQLGIDLSQANANSSGSKVTFTQDPDNPGVLQESVSDEPGASTSTRSWTLSPEFGFPPTATIDITLGYSLSENSVDDDPELATGSKGPKGSLGIAPEAFSMTLTFSQTEASTAGTVTKNTTALGGEVSKTLENGLSVELNVAQNAYETPGAEANPASDMTFGGEVNKGFETLDLGATFSQKTQTPGAGAANAPGAQSTMSIGVNGSASFEFGASVTGSFVMNTLTDYSASYANEAGEKDESGAAPQVPFLADGTEQVITGSFKLSPFDFIYGKVTYTQTTRTFDGIKPGDGNAKSAQWFEKNEADLITDLSMEIGASTTF